MNSLEQLETHHHVWVVDTKVTDAAIVALRDTLSSAEIDRTDRFAFEKDRIVYTAAHGALRLLLEHYLRRPASSFEFDFNAYGKPSLRSAEIEFNLSHSGHIALCAFSKHSQIGVDVEFMRKDVNPKELAGQFFSPYEAKSVQQKNSSDQLDMFYRCWTRKEAFVKAHGEGLSIPLDSFSVSIDSDIPNPVRWGSNREPCIVHPLDIDKPDYRAALAYFGSRQPIRIRSWNQWYIESSK